MFSVSHPRWAATMSLILLGERALFFFFTSLTYILFPSQWIKLICSRQTPEGTLTVHSSFCPLRSVTWSCPLCLPSLSPGPRLLPTPLVWPWSRQLRLLEEILNRSPSTMFPDTLSKRKTWLHLPLLRILQGFSGQRVSPRFCPSERALHSLPSSLQVNFYLLSIYCVSGTDLDAGDTAADNVHVLMELSFYWGETYNKQNKSCVCVCVTHTHTSICMFGRWLVKKL